MKKLQTWDEDFPIHKLIKENFPAPLLEIPQPPTQLYYRGELPSPETKWLCVVGARRFSAYGKEVCEKLIAGLRGYDVTIVSGLAMGIDAIAHEAAIKNGLRTVAVPGSGLGWDTLFPKTNLDLAYRILENHGAILSEFEENFRATSWSFPQRNRIMAGLCQAVLIIEAEVKSGTMITSRLATDYNRDVFTIPGNIFSQTAAGPHLLLRLGATPITNPAELRQALGLETEGDNPRNLELQYNDCSPEEKKIIELLRSPKVKDDLLNELDWPINQANAVLSIMELKGLIKESLGEIHLT